MLINYQGELNRRRAAKLNVIKTDFFLRLKKTVIFYHILIFLPEFQTKQKFELLPFELLIIDHLNY